MPATPVNSTLLQVGAGWLWVAALGTDEPTDCSTPMATVDAAWTQIGYTAEGHVFTTEAKREGLIVAEAVQAVRMETTEVSEKIEFSAAEITATNLQRAVGTGTVTVGATTTTFTPGNRAVAQPNELMIVWESFYEDERLILRRCVQTGPVGIARKKAPAYATIPMAFMLLQPRSGDSWAHLFANARG